MLPVHLQRRIKVSENEVKQLKETLDRIRSEKSSKEGERKVLLSRFKDEFGIEFEAAYTKFDDISREREQLESERSSLLAQAQERLAQYAS